MKLKDIGEFGFIDRIAPMGNVRPEGVVKGIGDDCAVIQIRGDEYLLLTTDLLVEKIHFLMDWAAPEIIGARALTANLSDIAACGGDPRDAFLSLAIPDWMEVEWLDAFYRGLTDLARRYQVNVLGGDTTSSKSDFVINIVVTGLVPAKQVLFRHTANEGDIIILTGPTGLSGAGCDILLNHPDLKSEAAGAAIKAHLEPRSHVAEGRMLAASGSCSAAIDVSDGISSDLGHLCRDSGVGAVLYEEKIPIAPELTELGKVLGKDPLDWVLNGGEDYVLLAAIRPTALRTVLDTAVRNGWKFYPIGEFVSGRKMQLIRTDGTKQEIAPAGWDHFA
jgi:thiamine-monophosphate kinase